MPTVIQGDSVNLLPGIIRLTGMTAILSALTMPQGYGAVLESPDPFAPFMTSDQVANNPFVRVEGPSGTVPLSAILAMKSVPFNRFYEVTGVVQRTLPKATKRATQLANTKKKAKPTAPRTAVVAHAEPSAPASAEIDRFIDEELSADSSVPVAFQQIADEMAEAAEPNPRLKVSQKSGKTTFNRDTLTIYEDQDHVQLDVDHTTLKAIEDGKMAVFIRNPDILSFDKATMRLNAKGRGSTELYFVSGSQSMAIIPVEVTGTSSSTGAALAAAPKQLRSLNALMAATYPQSTQTVVVAKPQVKAKVKAKTTAQPAPQGTIDPNALASLERASAVLLGEDSITAAKLPEPKALKDIPGTLMASAGQVSAAPAAPVAKKIESLDEGTDSAAALAASLDDRVLTHGGSEWRETNVTLKVGDERSTLFADSGAQPRIYPISGLAVKVLGTEDSSASDARGEVDLGLAPRDASFLVSVDDPRGKFAPSTVEIATGNGGKKSIKLLSQKNLNLYSDLNGSIQKSWLGSACITVKAAADDRGLVEDLSGLTVAANTEADGPLYFNRNLPRPNSTSLDSEGRFCFFNIEPGLVELGIKDAKGGWLTGFAVPVFAGRHLEDEVVVGDGQLIRTQVSAVPGGAVQIAKTDIALEDYSPVDSADLLALGDQAEWDSSMPSFHSLQPGYSSYKGRVHVLAKGADLETSLYSLPATPNNQAMPVITALPRGFIEDLHENLYQDQGLGTAGGLFEPSLGSAVVFFGHFAKTADSVTIKLLDDRGQEVDTGWYFGGMRGTPIKGKTPEGMSKAVFFNLQPGIYTAVVETEDGIWLDSKTLAVDFWTASVVNAGNPVVSQQ